MPAARRVSRRNASRRAGYRVRVKITPHHLAALADAADAVAQALADVKVPTP